MSHPAVPRSLYCDGTLKVRSMSFSIDASVAKPPVEIVPEPVIAVITPFGCVEPFPLMYQPLVRRPIVDPICWVTYRTKSGDESSARSFETATSSPASYASKMTEPTTGSVPANAVVWFATCVAIVAVFVLGTT